MYTSLYDSGARRQSYYIMKHKLGLKMFDFRISQTLHHNKKKKEMGGWVGR